MLNTLQTGLLMTALTALLVVVGYFMGGTDGMAMFLGISVLLNFGSYWFSDKIVLRMSGARLLTQPEAPQLFASVDRLCQRGHLPMPRLYLIEDPQPNAFATGRDPAHAAVAVNSGLLQLLDQSEVEGVLAHELAHIKHRDILTMSIVATAAGAIMLLSRFIFFFGGGGNRRNGNIVALILTWILAPTAAMIIQCLVSQSREYEADAGSARLTGNPQGLISALSKLERGAAAIPSPWASQQTAHMFIVNPLRGSGRGFLNLFRTHPPMEKRIAALQALAPLAGTGNNPWS